MSTLANLTFDPQHAEARSALLAGCERIAPTWPLDQLIAVNPWWELRHLPFTEASARLAALARVRCLMPRTHYARASVDSLALQQAALEAGHEAAPEGLHRELAAEPAPGHWHNVSDLLDSGRDREHRMAWRDEITQQISQFCGSMFQQHGQSGQGAPEPGGLYREWLRVTRLDRGISILMGEPALARQYERLPVDADALVETALAELGIGPEVAEHYAHALLLDVNGWASWIAYLRWQARLDGSDESLLPDLLAIRLAWELVLWRHQAATDPGAFRRTQHLWRRQICTLPELLATHREAQRAPALWQRAAELTYQRALTGKLRQPAQEPADAPLELQAVFCIDVRSEVIRRHLEARHPGIRTVGFAGFFGLPLEYRPTGSALRRPQLPGLLKPAIQVIDQHEPASDGRGAALNRQARAVELADAAPAAFGVVEALGLSRAWSLLRATYARDVHTHPVNRLHADPGTRWQLSRGGVELTLAERVELVAGILRAMGLTRDFARTVLLVGHGSSSRNNPHAASLDCGACGGQTGEINARVLADLLNDSSLRSGLAEQGIQIDEATRFVPALHDTITDEINCLGSAPLDPTLQGWLRDAAAAAREERSARNPLPCKPGSTAAAAAVARTRDWSQVRPEWGLAGCAAFVVAPRARTRHLDLEGRVFLHDYQWQQDPGAAVLELILTAPMVVTNWISTQYYASVTDNLKYGSGNKVLHNVVGGNLGVFEGNGGDLRIGLPLQSVHDGERWVHEPLRLSVYVAAPREPMADIVARHEHVRQLVDNEWLYLFRLDDDGRRIERLCRGEWLACAD